MSTPQKQEQPTLTEQKQYWDERWDRTRTPNDWAMRRARAILDLLRPLPFRQPRILDIGCGTGWFTEQLAALGEPLGFDLSERAIEIARSQSPQIRYVAGNLYEHQFEGRFDLVVAQEVIAHVEDQVRFVSRVAEILNPGGYFVTTTVNRFVFERMAMRHQPDPDQHIKLWLNLSEFQALLRPHFRVLATTSVIPMGGEGILRIVNSHKLNTALGWFLPEGTLERWKEKAGLGFTLIVLAQKGR